MRLCHGLDKYGRTIADVLLSDGTNVNHTLVKDGWCWWYRKYAPGDTALEKLEKEAREAKKGLWAPIRPWIYPKARRGQSLDLSDLVPIRVFPPESLYAVSIDASDIDGLRSFVEQVVEGEAKGSLEDCNEMLHSEATQ